MPTLEQQKQFFEAFGYLSLPGLLKDDISWIIEEFTAVFTDRGIEHDTTQRTTVVPFIDQRAKLCTLLDHAQIVPVVQNLLGADFNYLGGDGNYYTGDTTWHSDGFHSSGLFVKVALYLDSVTRDTGCLRVIPGSHRVDLQHSWDARRAASAEQLWGIGQRDVPAIAIESQPGDVVIFNHNLMHAAFGGSSQRRMFTLNLCRHCETTEEIADLQGYIHSHDRFWIDAIHSDTMRQTASEQRMTHLKQVMEHETQLPALSAAARLRMAEPSRG